MIRSQSTRRARRSRLGTALVAGLAAGVVLTGCSAGQITQTSQQRPANMGIQASSGNVKIVDAYISSPPISDETGSYTPGDIATVSMLVVNNAQVADEVTGIEIDGQEAEFSVRESDAEIPAQGAVQFGDDGEGTISFEVQDELYPGMYLPAVVTLKEAGEISFDIAVSASSKELPRDPDQNAELHTTGGGH